MGFEGLLSAPGGWTNPDRAAGPPRQPRPYLPEPLNDRVVWACRVGVGGGGLTLYEPNTLGPFRPWFEFYQHYSSRFIGSTDTSYSVIRGQAT